MARPTSYTPERGERIVTALRAGNTRKEAAEYGGVDYTTFLRWLEWGERDAEGQFHEFCNAARQAEADCATAMCAILRKAAAGYLSTKTKTTTTTNTVVKPDGTEEIHTTTVTVTEAGEVFDWRAALEWLKRRRRAEWGDSLDINKLDDETLIRLLEADALAQSERAAAESAGLRADDSGRE